ncbi:hypothetical protein MVEN_01040000 [Mycena venus]|uniref:Uncharacterized protein n=1 Tax=Mycena venus TaxID=2733690 RepID=A0A8H6Y9T1_9AGAR|nr:hypothetical protein MVEN_01040000 [Mycena venus]
MSPLHHPSTPEECVTQQLLSTLEIDKGKVGQANSIKTAVHLGGDGKNASHHDCVQCCNSKTLKDGCGQGDNLDAGMLTEIVRDFLLLTLEHENLHGYQRTDVETILEKCAEMEGVNVSSYTNPHQISRTSID